ncbi:hypothetical protein CFOL_v3_17510 [Cephalotus follicularis]|uniref:UDPGT domain-containing protein n=1 Tax=Cephalotus follicularis TaxID=3775 RepID=A0A1Q3C199_CEPFO|nr:hypothetical protein CFOL_v3_17510 [Cephalotus follicularis]
MFVKLYDSFMPWVLDVAKELGIAGCPFFTQSWAVNAIYYHYQQGAFTIPLQGSVVSLPCLPMLHINDLSSFVYNITSYPVARNILLSQFSNLKEAYWILSNTFDKLEEEVSY